MQTELLYAKYSLSLLPWFMLHGQPEAALVHLGPWANHLSGAPKTPTTGRVDNEVVHQYINFQTFS